MSAGPRSSSSTCLSTATTSDDPRKDEAYRALWPPGQMIAKHIFVATVFDATRQVLYVADAVRYALSNDLLE